jgi:hypothetical protein
MERNKQRATKEQEQPQKAFKKPNSDYYRLDLIVRGVQDGRLTSEIKTDYKEYLETMSALDGISITKYIHSLIDSDRKNREKIYKDLKKLREQARK